MQTNTVNSSPEPKAKGKWTKRVGLIAAVLCVALLMGGFLTVLNAIHAGRTTSVGSHTTVTPTPQPTAPQVIQKALLTDSLTGSSEGVGPNLGGLTSTTHFTVGQQFWLVFLENAQNGGTFTAKWYANNNFDKTTSLYMPPLPANSSWATPGPTSAAVTPTSTPAWGAPQPSPTPNPTAPSSAEGNFSTTYSQATKAKVELYWNGHLEITLFFDVKPA